MPRITIDDLPVLEDLSREETRGIFGGANASLSGSLFLEEPHNSFAATEAQSNETGDAAKLYNIYLQNSLQKQQQTLQTMSNVSKMLHDTQMAVVRKIGG